jgi:uncharacterized protein (TIGR02001 family)
MLNGCRYQAPTKNTTTMKTNTKLAVAFLSAASSIAAQAADAPASFTASGNIALTSDYVFRGVSQTAGKAALQGGYDVVHASGLSAGLWASNVSDAFGGLEIDLYANYAFKLGAVDFSVGYINYTYNTAPNGGEANIAATYAGLTLKYSDGVSGVLSDYYYEANYSYDVAAVKGLNIGLHYGQTETDVYDYAVSASYPVLGFTATVSYSELEGGDNITAFTLKKVF